MEKRKYTVTITETLKMNVEVEAEDEFEAEQIVSDRWHNSEYILDADNFTNVDFKAREIVRKKAERDEI